MQISIDSSKRVFDINIEKEIKRIQKDIDVASNGYPLFWKHVKDYRNRDNNFSISRINNELKCPMNYLMNIKFKKFRSKETELPMEYFFNKFELENDRRKSKKVEELIEKYAIDVNMYNSGLDNPKNIKTNDLLLKVDFETLIEDIKKIYISNSYLGLISWLIDRTFLITKSTKNNADKMNSYVTNKPLLLKILYTINPKGVLQVFSKKM